MLRAGMRVARFNCSHGNHAGHARMLGALRRAARAEGVHPAVLADLQGPRVRLGDLGTGVELVTGARVRVTAAHVAGDATTLPVSVPTLPGSLQEGDAVLLADGTRVLRVLRAGAHDAEAIVEVGGVVRSHQGINVPGRDLGIPARTEKDERDLAFFLRQGADYVALSFASTPEHVLALQADIRAAGGHAQDVTKFEMAGAFARMAQIAAVTRNAMVARGDGAVELSIEQIVVLQKQLIRTCNALGKPVITATQMLQSMTENPTPTRAEGTDVANAMLDGTDAVMLSAETATGRYPVRTVATMARILRAAEDFAPPGSTLGQRATDPTDGVAQAAVELARDIGATAIVALTETGATARRLSTHRPSVPVLAATPHAAVARSLALPWGVTAFVAPRRRTTGALAEAALDQARAQGLVADGDTVLLTAGLPLGGSGSTNFVKIQRVGDAIGL
jgi:pyruvate kinase